ncbi:MAG: type III pantothenate kinase [Planctomycetota bacterium]|nr:type III pantothenate kinase [Planctomycetota bacterium]
MRSGREGDPEVARRKAAPDILVINVGNSRVGAARFSADGRILRKASFPTMLLAGRPSLLSNLPPPERRWARISMTLPARIPLRLPQEMTSGKGAPSEGVLGSVVPWATGILRGWLADLGLRVRVCGEDIPIGLAEVAAGAGTDRAANVLAAYRRSPRGAYVVDAGTALTVSVVDGAGRFLGGMIAPGLRMELNALAEGTALLPETDPAPQREAVGRDTRSAMLSGCVIGSAARVEGMLRRMREETGLEAPVFLTGGDAAFLTSLLREKHTVVPDLTLEGLYWAWRDSEDASGGRLEGTEARRPSETGRTRSSSGARPPKAIPIR